VSQSTKAGTLFVVATPIGNLADMVPRAIDILHKVDLIAAEDTRHSGNLMQHFGIATAMTAYHDYSDQTKTQMILTRLQQGDSVALISDAGTPLISDPGYRLVHDARILGIRVEPIPGACALIAALCASGLPSDRFSFEGFLPAKKTSREKVLEVVKEDPRTLIFYESPHRILASLKSISLIMSSDRKMVLARELTKTFETFIAGSIADVIETLEKDANQTRGEMVIMIAGFVPTEQRLVTADVERTLKILCEELPLKKAAAIAAKITGAQKNMLYQMGLQLNKSE
jgi:16S rRNA (cytidine1402-2'-O)-methyltransferase